MFQFLKKIKLETIFAAIGILSLIIIASVSFYAINFLVRQVEVSLEQAGTDTQKITRFNLDGLKALGIIKESGGGSPSEEVVTSSPTPTATLPAAIIPTSTEEVGTTTEKTAE